MKLIQRLIILVAFLQVGNLIAQETQKYSDAWFLLLNNYKFNEHWAGGSEIHWRSTDFLDTKEQLLLRPFVTYKASNEVAYTLGYTYIESYPYAEGAIQETKPEHNIWEQVTLSQQVKKLAISHRFRLEQRFQGVFALNGTDYEVDRYDFSNRFRYRLTLKRAITEKLFVHVFDELWIRMDKNFDHAVYGRNWLYLGLGYKVLSNANVQLAYLHQNINKGSFYEQHPTVQLTFQYDFDFSNREE